MTAEPNDINGDRDPAETDPGVHVARIASLTAREREVLVHLAEGFNNGEICRRLGCSAKTVETHLSNLRRKLGVRDRVRLAWIALSAGLVAVQTTRTVELQGLNSRLRDELAQRELARNALRMIDGAVTPVVGEEFLLALAAALRTAAAVDLAIILEAVEVDGKPHLAARAIAGHAEHPTPPPLPLTATCVGSMRPEQALHVDDARGDAIAELLMTDDAPPSMIAVPLHDAAGVQHGAIALVKAGPIDRRIEPGVILRVYAERVVAELARLRIAAELTSSMLRYRIIADHATDMISVHSPTGAYTYASPACEALLGYRGDELVGKSAYDLMDSRDIAKVGHVHHELLTRPGASRVRYVVRRKDGRPIWLETDVQPITRPGSNEILELIAVSRDVTAEQHAIEALSSARAELEALVERRTAEVRATEMRWRSVCELASDYITVLDTDLRIIYINRTLPDTTVQATIDTPVTDYVDPDHAHAIELMQSVLRTGRVQRTEFDTVTPAGRVRWVTTFAPLVDDGRVVGLICVGQDFSAVRRIEATLRESERHNRILFEGSPEGLIVHDGERIRLANQRVAELLGYPSPAALIGLPVMELVQDKFRSLVRRRVSALLSGTGAQPRMRQPLLRSDGSVVTLEVAARSCSYDGRPAVQTSMRPIGLDAIGPVDDRLPPASQRG